MKPRHLIADPVVDCIASSRDPTLDELFSVAERIWKDLAVAGSAMPWRQLPRDSLERLTCLRAAQAALRGSP